MFILAYAASSPKTSNTGIAKTTPTTRGKTIGASNVTRSRGVSDEALDNYRRMWNNEIGIRTLTQRMQSEGFTSKQIYNITRST